MVVIELPVVLLWAELPTFIMAMLVLTLLLLLVLVLGLFLVLVLRLGLVLGLVTTSEEVVLHRWWLPAIPGSLLLNMDILESFVVLLVEVLVCPPHLLLKSVSK